MRRLALLVAVLLAVTFLAFSAMNLLGDPLFNVVGVLAELDCESIEARQVEDPSLSVVLNDCETIAEAKATYHLDRPVPVRYVLWLRDMATGDFGTSFQNEQPVAEIIREKLPETLILLVMAQIVSLGVAIPWGVMAAYRANRGLRSRLHRGLVRAVVGAELRNGDRAAVPAGASMERISLGL